MLFVGLLAASVLLLLLSVVLGDHSMAPVTSPRAWLASLDLAAALDTLANAAEVVAAVLAIAMTVVAIVVELAATRYSHEITRLFLREPVNIIVLGLFVLTTLQCVWISAVIGEPGPDALLPQAGFAITLGMVATCLLLLVPYIYFVFTFLSPISVIERICRDAYRRVVSVKAGNVARHQHRVEEAIDQLQDVARSAIEQGDRGIAMAAVDAMGAFLADYARSRGGLPKQWFDITASVAEDPDFVALAPETMAEVRREGIWLERKVFRRYVSLMGQSAINARDVAYLIGINTQRLAREFGADHPPLLELCLRSFNSYLRTTIGARDARSAYQLMYQCHNLGLSILLEVAAFDVKVMAEAALEGDDATLDALIDCLLQLDQEIKEEKQEESLLGVRRSQIQLAVRLIDLHQDQRVMRIVKDLRGERLERLQRVRERLEQDDRAEFWEIVDRGVSFSYLAPELRRHLDELFRRIQAASVLETPN
jgi:hypothetical protein